MTRPPAPASPRASAHRRARPLACLTAIACASALAACGSSHSTGTEVDPAGVVPASAPLYAGATVRPAGALKDDALSAGHALTGQADPYLRLLAALQTPGSPALDFSRDVAPWLGPHAGVFLTSLHSAGGLGALLEQGLLGRSGGSTAFPFSSSGAQGALVLDTTDATRAQKFLDGQAAHAGAHAAGYRGVAYRVSGSGVAFGLVDRLAVLGSESALRAVIDTSRGAPSLSHAPGYAKLLADAPSGALAHLYSSPASGGSSSAGEGLSGMVGLLGGGRQANVSLVPSASTLTLDADTLQAGAQGAGGGLLGSDPGAAEAFNTLPGDSWLAIGLGHVGRNLPSDLRALRGLTSLGGSSGSGSLSVKSLLGGLLSPLEVLGAATPAAARDFTSWMGSAGIFAAGGSLLELKAAVVIQSNDAARSRAAVAKLAAQLRKSGASLRPVSIPGTEAAVGVAISGLPVVLDIAAGRGADGHPLFVIGFAEASVATALNPPSTLAAAAPRAAAASTLGDGIQPSLIVDFPTLLSLLEGVSLTEDPSISGFVPYLRAATTLAGGGHSLGGGVERLRVVLGLHQSG
ncbi:MAG TPA: DUF3352 domain-containing protein [Solirubrobacteraceae bacterium]|jgi:hypothetical protein